MLPDWWAGRCLRVALVLGGMMSAFGMFNALVMSYSRLPLAMAQDGMLPAVFSKVTKRMALRGSRSWCWPPAGRCRSGWASSGW